MFPFQVAADWQSQRRCFVLATVTDTGGSTPRLIGSQMLISASESVGTIGGGALEYLVEKQAKLMIQNFAALSFKTKTHTSQEWINVHLVHDLGMCCGGKMTILLQQYTPTPRLWIYGAGHVGSALAQHAALLDLELVVIDHRPEWASPDRFQAKVKVCCEDPEEELRLHPPTEGDFVVVTTHDHQLDERLISSLSLLPLQYIGLIGSRGKWGRFQKRLKTKGVSESNLKKVHCPVGLDIGAQTPEEIAISILAEIIQIYRSDSSL